DVMKKPARMMGGQGLMSTTEDYARFCAMMANKGEYRGARVLKKETVELMTQNHLKEIKKIYGLGGMVNGKGGYQWGGAAGTRFWVDTKDNGYGVFMVQTWGYSAPTFGVFEKHAREILGKPPKK
ncbi:beta-lactamase family protein, partial [Verrucomicrobiales bacterium]|nr:beta-lactamase family protein [Verrucomicrobiales bacterium]